MKTTPAFHPFKNEEDAIGIGELTVENRLDRIEIYGSISLTRDKTGLELALQLKQLVDTTGAAMQSEKLPDKIPITPTENVDNPFKS